MRKIDKKLNIQKANIIAENLYISSKNFVKELESDEPKMIGDEGIRKYVAEKLRQIETLEEEKKTLDKEIKRLKKEIENHIGTVTPNQLEMF